MNPLIVFVAALFGAMIGAALVCAYFLSAVDARLRRAGQLGATKLKEIIDAASASV